MILPKEYLNVICQICTTNNTIVGTGRITEVEDNHIIISNTSDVFPMLKFLTYVKITCNHPTAGYKVILATVTDSSLKAMRLSSLFLLTGSEKRGYFRVHVKMETKLFYRTSAERKALGDATSENVDDGSIPSIDVVIRDMSLSGVLFDAKEFLQVGQVAVIGIEINKKSEPFLISVKRRFSESNDKDPLYQYGCVFNEKNSKKMDELCRIILKLQADGIRKAK